jgi:transcriptional regulator with XRE-family HTH domain
VKHYNIFSEVLPKEEKERFEGEVAGERAILDASELIHNAMKEKSLNQKQLAEILGVTKGYVSRLLSGHENLSVKNVALVLHALGYSYKQEIVPINRSEERTFENYTSSSTEIVDIKMLSAKRTADLPYKIA